MGRNNVWSHPCVTQSASITWLVNQESRVHQFTCEQPSKKLAGNLLLLPVSFSLFVRRVLKLSMFYLCRSLAMRNIHTYTHADSSRFRISRKGYQFLFVFNISFLFYFDTIFSLFFFCFHQSNKGMEGNFSSDLSIKEFFSSSVHFNEKDKSFIIK